VTLAVDFAAGMRGVYGGVPRLPPLREEETAASGAVTATTYAVTSGAVYLKRSFTWLLASVKELAGFLPDTTASIAGSMMPLTLAVLSVMG
jgi:hypothetical protein